MHSNETDVIERASTCTTRQIIGRLKRQIEDHKMGVTVSICFGLLAFFIIISAEELVVTLNHGGEVLGSVMKSQQGQKFYAFRGIPFAEPPTGQRRFQPPVPKASWKGTRLDATKDGPVCVQIDPWNLSGPVLFGQEDCLYLNVYTPQITGNKDGSASKKAVLVWIHGGGFFYGEPTSTMYGPGRIMDDPNIILVTISYRLGALGFLGTNDDASPGNYGMMDQSLALQWVHDHIEAFGGDSNHVTIFGESAGGASVGYHLLSPMSSGLFHAAISNSGSPMAPWAFKEDPMFWAKKLAAALECQTDKSSELVECLKQIPAVDLVTQSMEIMNSAVMSKFIFAPTLDGKFLLHSPRDIMSNGNIPNKVPLISGINKDESITFYLDILTSHPETDVKSKEGIYQIISRNLDDTGKSFEVAKLFVDKYLSSVDISNSEQFRESVLKMLTHVRFEMPHYETVSLRAKHGLPTYAYRLDYDPSVGFNELIGSELKGVTHADDLFLVFDGSLFGLLKPNNEDQRIIDVLRAIRANFANFGEPTPNTSELLPHRWERAADGQIPVYHIDNPITTSNYDTGKEDLYRFWADVVQPALQKTTLKNKL